MRNEQFIKLLRQLKREGIPFKQIASECNIPAWKVYHCINYNAFPYELRKQMEGIIFDRYREIIYYE